MHGMAQAAKAKGLSAAGMKISTDELRPNNIVHVILDGTPHYSCLLYTSPSPRDGATSRMPSSA